MSKVPIAGAEQRGASKRSASCEAICESSEQPLLQVRAIIQKAYSFVRLAAKGNDHGFYYPGLNIAYNVDESGLITSTLLDLSGKGCRLVEQLNNNDFDWFAFMDKFRDELYSKIAHISRIDLACDIYDDTIDYDKVLHSVQKGHYCCLSEKKRWIDGDERCIYLGSEKSDRFLRIYDKALEQCIDGKWIRFEFQLRNESAMSVWLTHYTCPDLCIGEIYSGNLKNYIRFVQVPRGQDIKEIKMYRHQMRLSNTRWWDNFIGNAEKLPQLYLPGEEYTLDRLEYYIRKQLASSLKAYVYSDIRTNKRVDLLGELLNTILQKDLNAKQLIMLDQLEHSHRRSQQRLIELLLYRQEHFYELRKRELLTKYH